MSLFVRQISRWLSATLLSILLSACASVESGKGYYALPVSVGDQLIVQQELVIIPGNSRLYVQYGEAFFYTEINQYEPFCFFRMRETAPVQQTVPAGTYTVTAVARDETEVVRLVPILVASDRLLADGGGYGPTTYQLFMTLKFNDGQTGLRDLVCMGGFAAPYATKPVTMEAILSALGELASFIGQVQDLTAR